MQNDPEVYSAVMNETTRQRNKIELIAAFLGIAVAGIPVFFRRFFEEKLPKKLFKILENIFAYGMLFYFVTFLCLSGFIKLISPYLIGKSLSF